MRVSLSMIVSTIAVSILLAACQGETSNNQTTDVTPNPGKLIFDQQCAICHGKTGKGDTMIAASYPHANLTDSEWGWGGSRADLTRSVTDGVPKTPMRGFKGALSEKEIDEVVSYVLKLSGS